MKLNLTFKDEDFKSTRDFQRAVEKQIGRCYVGTDSLCFYFDYPKELVERLRPQSSVKQLEFELTSTCPDSK